MDKCKDCIHCKQCAKNAHLPEFNPENIAYRKKFVFGGGNLGVLFAKLKNLVALV